MLFFILLMLILLIKSKFFIVLLFLYYLINKLLLAIVQTVIQEISQRLPLGLLALNHHKPNYLMTDASSQIKLHQLHQLQLL